jgi:hypothetical protein
MADNTFTMKCCRRACALAVGLVLWVTLLAGAARTASPVLAPVFNHGAVVQCEMPAKVWGTAGAGDVISLLLDGKQVAETTTQVHASDRKRPRAKNLRSIPKGVV